MTKASDMRARSLFLPKDLSSGTRTGKRERSKSKLAQQPIGLSPNCNATKDIASRQTISVPRDDKVLGSGYEIWQPARIGGLVYHLYLMEIAQTDLLSPEEEAVLANQIRRGDKEARERMIKANLRLVVKIAHEYEHYGLPLLDLINEGNIGLMKAVERFDPQKGAKLSTYASLWIRQSIRRALSYQSKTVRLPVQVFERIAKMRRIIDHYQEDIGREPTEEELAEELGTTVCWLRKMRRIVIRSISLEAPLKEDQGSRSYAESVADEKMLTAYEKCEQQTIGQLLRELINQLNTREATILRYRFGLEDGNPRTLKEIGRQFGLSRERIRQLQNIALKKLRKLLEERKLIELHPV